MDAVFSLQRAGADAVFSLQFTTEAAAPARSGGGIFDVPRIERPGITAPEIARLIVPLFEMGVFDA